MIAFAFWATAINYLDRQTLSVAAPVLLEQFHMSNTAYSRVLFGFLLAYTITNGISGPLIDRLGTRLGYALCMAWWSVAAVMHGLTRGAWSLGIFRFLLGMGEAGNWPAAVKVVAEWFPDQERALASGIFNSGSAVGAILAPPVVVLILLHLSWKAAFVLVGAMGFLWLVLWWPVYRTPGVSAVGPEIVIPLRRLLETRFVISFTVAKLFLDPVWYFYIFWFPEYLKRARHLDMAFIGSYAWIPFAVAGLGNLLGGWLSGFLMRLKFSVTAARKLSVSLFVALMLAAIPAVQAREASQSIALISVATLGYTGSLANMLAMPADVFPQQAVASVYGLASMGSGLGGMVFMLLTGWALDRYSYTPVFIGFGLLPVVCAWILWAFLGPLDRPALIEADSQSSRACTNDLSGV
jgi:ACS family hexuronate transporter-like MFS transporter